MSIIAVVGGGAEAGGRSILDAVSSISIRASGTSWREFSSIVGCVREEASSRGMLTNAKVIRNEAPRRIGISAPRRFHEADPAAEGGSELLA